MARAQRGSERGRSTSTCAAPSLLRRFAPRVSPAEGRDIRIGTPKRGLPSHLSRNATPEGRTWERGGNVPQGGVAALRRRVLAVELFVQLGDGGFGYAEVAAANANAVGTLRGTVVVGPTGCGDAELCGEIGDVGS